MVKGSTRSGRIQVSVIAERCKGCGFCIEFCPKHLLYQTTESNSKGYHIVDIEDTDKCTGCNICSMLCPEFAINVVFVKGKPE